MLQIHKHWLEILPTPVLEQEFNFLQMSILHSFRAAAANYALDKGNCGPYFKHLKRTRGELANFQCLVQFG